MKKITAAAAAAAMIAGVIPAAVNAETTEPKLYSGYGALTVIQDPTGADKGNVFSFDGYEQTRGNDKERGRNPFIEMPVEYLYDKVGSAYKLKDKFSVAFDIYTMANGTRYAFYTGTDDTTDNKATGLYYIPETGGDSYIEVITDGAGWENARGEYESIKNGWHRFEISRDGGVFTVYKDGEKYSELKTEWDYSMEREPVFRLGYSPYAADGGLYAYIDNIEVKNGDEVVYSDTADGDYDIISEVPEEPDKITVNTDISDGSETAALIENRPDIQRRMELLDRGVTAVKADGYGLISWRWLGTESADTMYNIYKNGEKLNDEPLNATNYVDRDAAEGDKYSVSAVYNGVESERSEETALLPENYIEIKIDAPAPGSVTLSDGTVEQYSYVANDAGTADLDGDGEYEIIIKWDPTNSRDSAHLGNTGNTMFDAYKLDGTKLWRIDLGKNVRSGAHDTQFIAADFNGDGKGEVAMRTADGTVDGAGNVIGDASVDWRDENGKNLSGPLYLTVFDGETGAVIDTVDYIPQSQGEYDGKTWDISSWGDDWGNRSERYNAAVAYIDGVNPSMIFARGYYDRTAIASFTMKDNKIVNDWLFDTYAMEDGDKDWNYRGMGNHSVAVADVDYDGKDEIVYGSMLLDDNGEPVYSTKLNHGDAQHTGDLIIDRPGLETFSVHEWGAYGHDMRDARTGEIIWYSPFGSTDVGRGVSDDIDPRYPGAESWSSMGMLISSKGEIISEDYNIPANFLAWWDGDLCREIQDSINISKWNPYTEKSETIFTAEGCHSNNAGKSNPSLTADILGDWREEVIYPTEDNSVLRIYMTNVPTGYRIPTLMHDPGYRASIAVQNVGYNQPAHTDFYLGYDTESIPVMQIYTESDGVKMVNPDLDKKKWDIESLYTGTTVEMAIGSAKAFISGTPCYIDGSNKDVKAYIENDRTMVPLRFISEAFGAYVTYDDGEIHIQSTGCDIIMNIGENEFTVNGSVVSMDTAPVIKDDVTFVPLRYAAEALGKEVAWDDVGLVTVSDKAIAAQDGAARIEEIKNSDAAVLKSAEGYKNGEKLDFSQADLNRIVTYDGSDGSAAVDLDIGTSYSLTGKSGFYTELKYFCAMSGVVLSCADGGRHTFKVYTGGSIDNDAGNFFERDGWDLAAEITTSGTTTEPEMFIFPVPKYGTTVKLVLCDTETGETDKAEISEFGVIAVK